MLALKSVVFSVMLLLTTQVSAMPNPQLYPAKFSNSSTVPSTPDPSIVSCSLDPGVDPTCPRGYTCCGYVKRDDDYYGVGVCRKTDEGCLPVT